MEQINTEIFRPQVKIEAFEKKQSEINSFLLSTELATEGTQPTESECFIIIRKLLTLKGEIKTLASELEFNTLRFEEKIQDTINSFRSYLRFIDRG